MITVNKITTRDGLEGLKPVWNSLLAESAANCVTLTWEWLTTWWDVFGADRELNILVASDGREIIGIAPLLKRTVQHYGLLPFRRLELLASGEDEADEICSDYLDFIIRNGREGETVHALLDYLFKTDSDWDEILLTDMAAESRSLPALKKLCEATGTKCEVMRDQIGTYLSLPADWDELVGGLSQNFRRKIQKDRRTLAANGGSLQITDSREGFDEAFDALVRLHQQRWTSRGEPGVFASEKFTRFHRTVAPKLLDKGWLQLFIVNFGGEPVSALYAFTYNGKMYYYQGGFSEAKSALASPGTLVQSYAVETAIKMGLSEYDFLKGGESGYKTKWGGQTRSIIQIRLAQPDSKEVLYSTTTRVLDGLRSIKRA
ncbi:MAG TPA: GNAT family N-acetyltransferase, partial [Blastocatellia bacterium]|nr:GNAT family N-acetyltransferase [Blastocatellia bacterium]